MLLKQKNLFSKEECDLIISLEKTDKKDWHFYDRKYESLAIIKTDTTEWIFNKLKNFFEDETGIKIISDKNLIHFHTFTKDDKFELHDDIRDDRVYSVGVCLNNDFDGGEFIVYNPLKINLNKEIGNTYIFDVRIKHQVRKVKEGVRYSLLWFLQKKHLKFKTEKLL
ncbi:MAG: hypothetical protein FJ187_08255 [Gammaproteobacteria bacterium]|nr:hypothetical protein [Gammaproteobacteria bacterium]